MRGRRAEAARPIGPTREIRRRKHGSWFYVSSITRRIWQHPANRSRRLRSLLKSVLWQIRKRLTSRPMESKAAGGLTILCFPDSSVSSALVYFSGWPEIGEMEFVDRYLRPGDGFVDGGANIGVYTLLAAARVGRNGWIDAFEPAPLAAHRLRHNVARNDLATVQIHEAAIDETAGATSFLVGWDVSDRIACARDIERGGETVRVSKVRLDDALAPDRHYAMAKLDLEGAELRGLRGARERLSRADPPVWQLEVTPHLLEKQGDSAEELIRFLLSSGYDVAVYDRASAGLRFLGEGEPPPANILAVARVARSEVVARVCR